MRLAVDNHKVLTAMYSMLNSTSESPATVILNAIIRREPIEFVNMIAEGHKIDRLEFGKKLLLHGVSTLTELFTGLGSGNILASIVQMMIRDWKVLHTEKGRFSLIVFFG